MKPWFLILAVIGIIWIVLGFSIIVVKAYVISQTNSAIESCNSFTGLLVRSFSMNSDMKCYQAENMGLIAHAYGPLGFQLVLLGIITVVISAILRGIWVHQTKA